MPKSADSDSETQPRPTSDDVDQHISDCDVCGGGKGICMEGYLLAAREQEPTDV